MKDLRLRFRHWIVIVIVIMVFYCFTYLRGPGVSRQLDYLLHKKITTYYYLEDQIFIYFEL